MNNSGEYGIPVIDESKTNFEWLMENDKDALLYFLECDDCCGTCLARRYCSNAGNHSMRWLIAPHDDAYSKVQSKTEPSMSEQAGSSSDEHDSREKLEADVRELMRKTFGNGFIEGFKRHDMYTAMINLLDRQAAITALEYMDKISELCAAEDEDRAKYELIIAKLQAKVDELERKRDA